MADGKDDADWDTYFNGTGSVTGNGWIEEVCHLGDERWLLRMRDDPAWSLGELDVGAPEAHTSESLVLFVVRMDLSDSDLDLPRTHCLLDVASRVGASHCERMLQAVVPV